MDKYQLLKMEREDVPVIKEIYKYYIENSTATFHIGAVENHEIEAMLFYDDGVYESFKIVMEDEIVGYIYIAPYKKREAYRRSAEVTIYLKDKVAGMGIGTKAMEFIHEVAKSKDIKTLLAVICGENDSSINLFKKMGYDLAGTLKGVGEKFGRVLDIVIYQKDV